ILGLQPDREPAKIDRLVVYVADPDAGHAEPVLVRVDRPERFAEGLADPVAAVGTHFPVGIEPPVAPVVPDRVVGGSEDDTLDTLPARRLEDVVAADDVGLEDRLPQPLDRMAAEVNDAVDAVDRGLDLVHPGEIGSGEALMGGEI